jgi:uncharacterized protein (DUF1501 family)
MDRRTFLHSAAALSASSLAPFSISSADAANVGDYKALVCVFLFGGNDSHNMIVPTTASEYNTYSTLRGGGADRRGLALPQASLLDLAGGGAGFGLHPALTNLRTLFNNDQKLAVVANTGVLLDDTTLGQYQAKSVPLPPQLFSHSDMQTHWQTMRSDVPADTGWGGRMADAFRAGASGLVPGLITLGSGNVFIKGDLVTPYTISPRAYSGATPNPTGRIARPPEAQIYWNWTGSKPQDTFVANNIAARPNLLEQQYAGVVKGSLEIGEFITNSMYNTVKDTAGNVTAYNLKAPVPGTWPATNRLASQLHSVAAMIAARQAIGVTRQIFFVNIGGFDNHGDQFGSIAGARSLLAGKHFDLMKQLDEALSVFYRSIEAMPGMGSKVTTMTMSDFGRTMKSNGEGSDHGWGGHQLVLGGSVKGGRIVGNFPMPSNIASVDVGEGRLLPQISSDAYAATLATWFGADSNDRAAIFPNLSRFNLQSLDLMV